MQITIDIDDEDFKGQVVQGAAHAMLNQTSIGPEGESNTFRNDLGQALHKKIDEAIAGYVKDVVREHAEKVLDRPLPKTDQYGDRVRNGETETVAEKIHAQLSKEIVTRQRNSYTGNSESILSSVINQEVEKALRADLQEELSAARKQVRDAVKAKALELFTADTLRAAGIK
ncbi:MAG: hypothetical protein H0U53_02235 [Actinobacteria bacterium]|nr:hypothetical protein [Actinomycetota bacterium]